MSAFESLRNVCAKFEEELRKVSADLVSAKIDKTFEDGIAKNMQNLSLFTSKVRLLRAKPLSVLPQVTEQDKNYATVVSEYEDLVTWRIVESQVVKSVTQANAVKTLITTKNKNLDPELVERKEKIIKQLSEYQSQETALQHLDTVLKEREAELARVRKRWDELAGELRDAKAGSETVEEFEATSPLYNTLQTLVDKMELMRWLICKFVTSRACGYDWLGDSHRRLAALKAARTHITVQDFLEPHH